ncbi:NAD-dependent epimerase/dehydratase family protein [Methylobacterium haplocladii]|uniref:GDP-6-deoxy-D-lyxo-4-hexulose reductase n=1 Tax=Methylobacterium haplocladii TaxID=1176176 RepID=A0A512INS4_9HYPH|nr:GDP-mannose 4,6-dehydratase [Methylobacterium haplocladii]GEO99288.1 GDP-6-deoxy-D-lyxo-4-hexulose reductase [Methylobacterium haplocladii]GJD83511.1 GDP-6-deoxy-D-mannose reductase [Methylobacterium haplocladii]GLS59456.1 GDP-6-deoxy-D-lyxo-4-hexulose reductase [Methylobacterium haplocladii]
MRRILVTGAAGFVGRHVVAALRARFAADNAILGIGRRAAAEPIDGADYGQVDLLDAEALARCLADFRPTDILHLAAVSAVQQSAADPLSAWRSNVGGLFNLVDAVLKEASTTNLFFVSSGEVYGRAFLSGRPIDETFAPEPAGSYARSKWIGEQMLLDILRPTQVRLVILRPFNHTGAGQDERFVVPSFAGQIARIEAGLSPPRLEVGNLTAQRDFLDVADVARAYVDLIAAAEILPSGTILNICSGRPRAIASILEDLRKMALRPFTVVEAPDRMRPSEIPIAIGDAGRLRAAIGWAPSVDWAETLAKVLAGARGAIG